MAYYRGDYYRGDGSNYYRGDPFIGGLIAGAAGKLLGKAGAWVGRQIGGRGAAGAAGAAAGTLIGTSLLPQTPGRMPIQIGPVGIDPRSLLPGGKPGITFGGERKRYRRMNPLNPKALRRALRRAEKFEKFARRTVNALRAGPKKFKSSTRRSS